MSMREQIPMKPAAAAAPPLFTAAPFATLQRKCACGGSAGSGGECAQCKKKKITLQRRSSAWANRAPLPLHGLEGWHPPGALREPALRSFPEAGPRHDFSRVRVDAPVESMVRLPELGCFTRLHDDTAGDTGCDVSIGTPTTVIHSPSLCYKACTERHEAVHVTDLSPCCKRAN
jgi:hypothetical protein